jgi:hypothetical protein
LGFGDERHWVAAGRQDPGNAGDETFRTSDAGFMEELVELLALGTLEGASEALVVVGRGVDHDHDAGRNRAFRFQHELELFDKVDLKGAVLGVVFEFEVKGLRYVVDEGDSADALENYVVDPFANVEVFSFVHLSSPRRLAARP